MKQRVGNPDKVYALEKMLGGVLDLTDEQCINAKDGSTTDNGIFSDEFNVDIRSESKMIEYSCKCGRLQSRFREGEMCLEEDGGCGTVVSKHFGRDILKNGWISISEPFYVIPSNVYGMIQTLIGNKILTNMLNYQRIINRDGHDVTTTMNKSNTKTRLEPFFNIGMMEFRDRFIEIINFYMMVKKGDPIKYQTGVFLLDLDSQGCVFTHHYPVMSPLLRPGHVTKNANGDVMLGYAGVNKFFTSMIGYNNSLKRSKSTNYERHNEIMWNMQMTVMDIHDYVVKNKLVGKTKTLRGELFGRRLHWSMRAVVVSAVGKYHRNDGVIMSYKLFLKTYRHLIINAMKRGWGNPEFKVMKSFEVENYIDNAVRVDTMDPVLYGIAMKIVNGYDSGKGLKVIMNRNPTFDMGSSQFMTVVDIFPDPKLLVLGVPITSVDSMNGDFDGDEFNVWAVFERRLIDAFMALSPTRLAIDRTGSSYFSPQFGLHKDAITTIVSSLLPYEDTKATSKYIGKKPEYIDLRVKKIRDKVNASMLFKYNSKYADDCWYKKNGGEQHWNVEKYPLPSSSFMFVEDFDKQMEEV